MDKNALEYRAVDYLQRLRRGKTHEPEDSQNLALPRLPKPVKAARRLAAMANAAQGEPLLWIIGAVPKDADGGEDSGENAIAVPGDKELEDWLMEVRTVFEGVAPHVEKLPFQNEEGQPLLALHVETDRAPFVIYRGSSSKVRQKGNGEGHRPATVRTEIPWLDGEGEVRGIRRLELLRMITPLRSLPSLELISAELKFWENVNRNLDRRSTYYWSLDATVYVVPRENGRIVLPFRQCRVTIESREGTVFSSQADQVNLTADKADASVIQNETALMISGIGQFYLFASGTTPAEEPPLKFPLQAVLSVRPAAATQAAVFDTEMVPVPTIEENEQGRWSLG